MMEKIFDYTLDDWQTMGAYAYFAVLAGALLAIALYMIVVAI